MSCANTMEILKQRLDKQWRTAWTLMRRIIMCIWPLNTLKYNVTDLQRPKCQIFNLAN